MKAQSYPTVQQPTATRVPRAMCGSPQVTGALCLRDGKEEGWKIIPASPVLTRCLFGSAQAWRLLANAEADSCLVSPQHFGVLLLISACVHNCACKGDQPVHLPCSWMMSLGQEAAWPRELQLHVHGPCPSLLPVWVWGEMSPPLPGWHCWRDPTKGKRCLRQCSLEVPHGGGADLMALVLPSSTQLSQRQRLGLLHPVLATPCPLQAGTPFTE